ncbi:MAG: protein kinase [Bacteroidales bacterium]|nr:protein kinase [Bacteroidales bacterium]
MNEPKPRPTDVTNDINGTRSFDLEPSAKANCQPCPPKPMPPSPDIPVPPELADHPRYKVLRPLGRGGMGAVFLAEHRAMGRTVALKTINPALLAGQETALLRFQQEVRAAASLNHPNIVQAYDADQAGNTHFLVMEYVDGMDLMTFLRRKGPLPIQHACLFVRQAALGLQHAHEKGMVHRDIKPQNLMLTRKGQVKVLDFGLARFATGQATEAGDEGLTNTGVVMGSADFIAPEQVRNAKHADIRADIYSLGCTLYTLLTGKTPFAGGESVMDKMFRHLTDTPEPLEMLRSEVPAELVAIVARMMEKEPAKRYERPMDVVTALMPFARPNGIATLPLIPPQAGSSGTIPVRNDDPQAEFADLLTEPANVSNKPILTKIGGRKTLLWGSVIGLTAAVMLAGVVIIKGKDGAETKIDVPDDATVEVKMDNKTVVKVETAAKPHTKPPTPIPQVDEKPLTFEERLRRAREAQNTKQWQTIVDEADAALKIEPWNTESLYLRGYGLSTVFHYATALADIEIASLLAPQDPRISHRRVLCLVSLHDYVQAIQEADRGLALDGPTHQRLDILVMRGLALSRLGEYARALEDLDECIHANPQWAVAYAFRAPIHDRLGHPELAAADRAKADQFDLSQGRSSLPDPPGELIVSPDGQGDHPSLTAAVKAAKSGTIIRLKPGKYTEPTSVEIKTNLTIIGDGEPGSVTLEFPVSPRGGGLVLMTGRVVLRNLVVRNEKGMAIWGKSEGDHLIENCSLIAASLDKTTQNTVILEKGASVVIRGCRFDGHPMGYRLHLHVGSSAVVENSEFKGGGRGWGSVAVHGARLLMRNSQITGSERDGMTIANGGIAYLMACEITGNIRNGLHIVDARLTVTKGRISHNGQYGIALVSGKIDLIGVDLTGNKAGSMSRGMGELELKDCKE